MNDSPKVPQPPPDALDRLTDGLLECGAVLSQIIAGMVEFEESGRAGPDTLPIPEAAHAVVKSALSELKDRHSRRDLKVAARIAAEATTAIAENVFVVDPEWLDSMTEDRDD